ncbi:MAG: hypothetical protein ACT452_04410 [Microthrixaceae bacterium]
MNEFPNPTPVSARIASSRFVREAGVVAHAALRCSFCGLAQLGTTGPDQHVFICDLCERDAAEIRDLQASIGAPVVKTDGPGRDD